MSKIVGLTGGEAIPGAAVPDVVEMLESVLARARRGEIIAVACAIVQPDGLASQWSAASWQRWPLLAALEMAAHRYKARAMQEADE